MMIFSPHVPRDIPTGVWPVYDIKAEKLIGQIYGVESFTFRNSLFVPKGLNT
jgi:hypothetical protein